jgi:hypothetical protein
MLSTDDRKRGFKMFVLLNREEAEYIDGGALVGATIGYIGGLVVGTGMGVAVAYNSLSSGSSGTATAKAFITTVGGAVLTGTIYGAIFGP